MKLPRKYLPHTVQVERLAGESSTGRLYDPPAPLRCLAEEVHRLVRDANGDEVTAAVTCYAEPGQAHLAPPGSRLTTPSGRVVEVIVAIDHDDGGMGAPQHTEVVCK